MDANLAAAVRAVQGGDADAFQAIVATFGRDLYRVAYRIVGEAGAAEDAVQEAFLRAYRAIGRFDERAELATWLHRIAVNTAIDQVRSRGRRREVGDLAPEPEMPGLDGLAGAEIDPERSALGRELGRAAEQALDGLTASERTAFVLRHLEGRSIAEIGATLGKRENATKQLIFRAVRKLRHALTPYLELAHAEASPRAHAAPGAHS